AARLGRLVVGHVREAARLGRLVVGHVREPGRLGRLVVDRGEAARAKAARGVAPRVLGEAHVLARPGRAARVVVVLGRGPARLLAVVEVARAGGVLGREGVVVVLVAAEVLGELGAHGVA